MNPGPRPPRILAIDPGETESAAVLFSGMDQPIVCELKPNPLIRQLIVSNATLAVESGVQLAIECAAGYGVPISMNLIKAIEWYGRFAEAWLQQDPGTFALKVPRGVVKNHLDNAKTDAQVRDALIHRWGGLERAMGPGQRRNKQWSGLLSRVHEDCWAALAVAVTVWETWGADQKWSKFL